MLMMLMPYYRYWNAGGSLGSGGGDASTGSFDRGISTSSRHGLYFTWDRYRSDSR